LCAWKAWFAIADAFCDFSIRETASVALGPLPPGAPPVCEMFRHYPDALERATELDAQYGSNSPLDEIRRRVLFQGPVRAAAGSPCGCLSGYSCNRIPAF
jgi:hypothetical protein